MKKDLLWRRGVLWRRGGDAGAHALWLTLARTLIALTCLFSVAHAQAPGDKNDAKALLSSGLKLFQGKDYLGALAVFKDGYARFPSAKFLLNIGTTLRLLDRKAEAANAYQRYLDAPDADAAKKGDVEKVLAELDKSVGTLVLAVTPVTATIHVGDELASGKLRVPPGEIKVRATAEKHEPYEAKVTAVAGQLTTVTFAMTPTVVTTTTIQTPTPTAGGPTEIHREVNPEAPPSRLGAIALAHVDIGNSGAAALVGIDASLTSRLSVQATALLGKTAGGYAGATFALMTGKVRPILAAGMPVFVSNGARFGVRGAGGVELVLHRHFTLVAEVGVEQMLNAEDNRAETLFVPAIGAIGRM